MAETPPEHGHAGADSSLSIQPSVDGWALVDLQAEAIIRADERGLQQLQVDTADLPQPLTSLLAETDVALVEQRLLPDLRGGAIWAGALRLPRPSAAQGLSGPVPLMAVPHAQPLGGQAPSLATLFFTANAASRAAVLVPDPLTGLPTRSALFDRLEQALRPGSTSRASTGFIAALFIDLDGLKNINDRYGHDVGDNTLIETAQRISAALGEGDIAARFGGDEFVVLCQQVTDVQAPVERAQQILAALQGVDDYQAISASIGIALGRAGEIDALELIRRSDTAMYQAKARGGSQVATFDNEMQNRHRADQALRTNLLDAIANNRFGVAAQPIFELATGRIRGVELFIRLRDDTPYIASANELFRLAHEHGEAIDAAILGRAIALAKSWQQSLGALAPRLHVNVSAQSLASSQFARRVAQALTRDDLRPRSVVFEVDGRDLSSAGDRERQTIQDLQATGVPIIVDSYNGDLLALGAIASWRPAMVKIAAPGMARSVLAGLVRGVSSLRIATCVKGIETRPMLNQVVALGAFAGQGNALTPVSQVGRVDRLVHQPYGLGF